MNAREKAQTAYVRHFGREPDGVVFAPGRVNLIGEHVDYNEGLVFPMPLVMGTAIAWGREGSMIEALAEDFDSQDCFDPAAPDRPKDPDWRSYVRGMAAHWPDDLPGLKLAISGDLPRGAGLSSSASVCTALGRVFASATGAAVDAATLARIAQKTEHDYAGVACGIMDQMAVGAGEPGKAMMLDCRDLSFRQVPIPAGWQVAVIESGVTRGLVDGEYNARRAHCEAAAQALGVGSLRNATMDLLEQCDLEAVIKKRARHVITEIARTAEAVKALEQGELLAFGRLLNESHISLRDDFEVSVEQVDALVASLQDAIGEQGGARMTGAGFGGAVVAVFHFSRIAAVQAAALGHPLMLI
jgi:galactokinase